MKRFTSYRLIPVVAALTCGIALGTAQSVAGKKEAEATAGRAGKTVFLDISALGRRDRAAKRMTEMHTEHAREGWSVQNVAVYIENGDLEGFFITYVK